ncbi:MAG TPA: cyclase family protein [Planctomycetota bacterium]|nr:cyclase family protein [Planctomycetota bacterium]
MNPLSRITFIDLSHRIDEATAPFPGDPPVEVRVLSAASGPSSPGQPRVNLSFLGMSLHCGTHADAPFHFFEDGLRIDQVPLEVFCGPAVLIRLRDMGLMTPIEVRHLSAFESSLRGAHRVVLHTGWHHRWGEDGYFTGHPFLTPEAARYLVDQGSRLVGVDMPSVDHAPHDAHVVLLGSGVVIVENLTNLDAIRGDVFQLACFPLKLGGRDGSPVRAVGWIEEG